MGATSVTGLAGSYGHGKDGGGDLATLALGADGASELEGMVSTMGTTLPCSFSSTSPFLYHPPYAHFRIPKWGCYLRGGIGVVTAAIVLADPTQCEHFRWT